MGWQRWHVAPGPHPSPPHNSWPTWNGGELTHMLCVPMPRCGWRSFSHESEVVSFWRNATGSVPKLWQWGKPIESGPCGKCSVILCRRCHTSLFESTYSEEMPHEMAGGSMVKRKGSTGPWVCRMKHSSWTVA